MNGHVLHLKKLLARVAKHIQVLAQVLLLRLTYSVCENVQINTDEPGALPLNEV